MRMVPGRYEPSFGDDLRNTVKVELLFRIATCDELDSNANDLSKSVAICRK